MHLDVALLQHISFVRGDLRASDGLDELLYLFGPVLNYLPVEYLQVQRPMLTHDREARVVMIAVDLLLSHHGRVIGAYLHVEQV